jgi:hypothetical protein
MATAAGANRIDAATIDNATVNLRNMNNSYGMGARYILALQPPNRHVKPLCARCSEPKVRCRNAFHLVRFSAEHEWSRTDPGSLVQSV